MIKSWLKVKLNLAVMLVVTLVLTLYGVWDTFRVQAAESARLERDIDASMMRLGAGLPKPLWDFALTTATDILRGEMNHPAVLAIGVLDPQGQFVLGLERRGESIETLEALPELPRALRSSRALSFDDGGRAQAVGEVVLLYSTAELRQAMRQTVTRALLVVLALNVILVVALGVALTRLVLDPLGRILERVNDIAEGEGDLSKRLDSARRDELGQLGQAMNRFIASISQIVREVNEVIRGLTDSAHEAKATAGGLNQQLSQQQQDLYLLTAAINEFSATTAEVARNAALAAEAGAQAGDRAGAGLAQVRQANDSNDELAGTIDQTAAVINELRDSTEAITGILDVIRGIAEQTNLLALNAAIEAARAGEHGRGFAVVADEVRVLSQRTQESTQRIQQTIEGLQARTQQAFDAMEQSKRKAAHSVEQASGAGSAFEEINASIQSIIQMMTNVATAAEEQSSTVAEIERNVSNIQQVHEETVKVSETTARSGELLSATIDRLRALFGKFKL